MLTLFNLFLRSLNISDDFQCGEAFSSFTAKNTTET